MDFLVQGVVVVALDWPRGVLLDYETAVALMKPAFLTLSLHRLAIDL